AVADVVPHEAPGIRRHPESRPEAILQVIALADVRTFRRQVGFPAADGSLEALRERRGSACDDAEKSKPVEGHEISLTHKLIAAFRGAEVQHLALDLASQAERGGDVGAAHRVLLQLAAGHHGWFGLARRRGLARD